MVGVAPAHLPMPISNLGNITLFMTAHKAIEDVCFQLGMLWGELVPEAQDARAADWYERAIEYLPGYVKARVHLAEIYLRCELAHEAEALLTPAIPSSDPEASWRLADVLSAMGRLAEGKEQIQAAQCGFETLLRRHLLAYADHGAEFYIGSGNDPHRAFTLAIVNLENRPTLRAFEQAHEIATSAGLSKEAARILTAARDRWGMTSAFGLSALAETHENP